MNRIIKGNASNALPPSGHQYSKSAVEFDMLAKSRKPPKPITAKRMSLK